MSDPFSRRERYLALASERAQAEHLAAEGVRSRAHRTRRVRNLAAAAVLAAGMVALLARSNTGLLLGVSIFGAAALAAVILTTRSYHEILQIAEAHSRAAGAFDRLRRSALLVILDPGMDEQEQRRAMAELDEIGVALDRTPIPD